MNPNELDDILDQIEQEENKAIAVQEEVKKDLTTVNFNGTDIAVDDDDAMMAAVFSSALEDKKRADELYQYFTTRIELDKDRSDSVREGLAKSVELRQTGTSNLIKLLDMRKKYSAKAAQGNSLVSLNLSPRETGINIKNLTDEILNS